MQGDGDVWGDTERSPVGVGVWYYRHVFDFSFHLNWWLKKHATLLSSRDMRYVLRVAQETITHPLTLVDGSGACDTGST